MFGDLDKYIAVFFTGLLVSYTLGPLVRKLALRAGVVDVPNERRPHKRPTARGGGLAIIFGVHAACLTAVAFHWPPMADSLDFHWWRHFTIASLVLLVVGVIDDVRGIKPWYKLAGQAVAGLQVWFSGARFGTLLGVQLPVPLDFFMVL